MASNSVLWLFKIPLEYRKDGETLVIRKEDILDLFHFGIEDGSKLVLIVKPSCLRSLEDQRDIIGGSQPPYRARC